MVSVTKLIDLLNKPGLLHWANKIGLNGISIKEYSEKSKNEGILKHLEIENYIKHGIIFEGYEKLKKSLEVYEILYIEKEIKNNFLIGRIDLVLKKNNKIYVCDFKNNKSIYINTKIQLSTYKHIINADEICYINSENFNIEILNLNTEKYYEIIKRLYQINQLLNNLNEKL